MVGTYDPVGTRLSPPRARDRWAILAVIAFLILAVAILFPPVLLGESVAFYDDHPAHAATGLLALVVGCVLSLLELKGASGRGLHVMWLTVAVWTLAAVLIPFIAGDFFPEHPVYSSVAVLFFALACLEGAGGLTGRWERPRRAAVRLFVRALSVAALMLSVDWFSVILRTAGAVSISEGADPLPVLILQSWIYLGLLPMMIGIAGVKRTIAPASRYWILFLIFLPVVVAATALSLLRYLTTFE